MAILILVEKNKNLSDKAGREGFIANKAYREFQDDLIQFFIDLADTYFRSIDKDNPDTNSMGTTRRNKEAK